MLKLDNLSPRLIRLRSIFAALALIGLVSGASIAHADKFDEQIKALSTQNSATSGLINELAAHASNYQSAINALQSQINAMQEALNANLARQASLQQQITEAQTKLDQQKTSLRAHIEDMYTEGQLSTIEELATSSNLSDFVDKEEYRISVQNKTSESIKEISALQAQLQQQKAELDVLVASQKQQNDQLAAARGEQQSMLSYNQGQQSAFNQQIKSNNGKIAELKRQQLAANSRFIGGSGAACGGGYPGSASGSNGTWGCNYRIDYNYDNWGMGNRQCVSYTAYRVAASGRYMPYWGGHGNANQWDENARRAGIPVDNNPQAGDVAISNRGEWGHAMYVESVNDDGTINISQYNADFMGNYSTRSNLSPGGLVFIHF